MSKIKQVELALIYLISYEGFHCYWQADDFAEPSIGCSPFVSITCRGTGLEGWPCLYWYMELTRHGISFVRTIAAVAENR